MNQCKTSKHTLNSVNKQALPVALVTGSARRIGAAIVKHLHDAGFDVVMHYHHSEQEAFARCTELNACRPASAIAVRANLIHASALLALMEQTLAWRGRLDVLVNNASLFIRTPQGMALHDVDSAWDAMWQANVKAPFKLSELAFPALAMHRGCIINLTDIHAEKPLREYGLYCQTKAALKMQTESLAREYAPKVRVNAVAPGAIAWPEGDNTLLAQQQAAILAKTPLQCHGEPRWVAEAVLALIQNTFITGQTLTVSGGR